MECVIVWVKNNFRTSYLLLLLLYCFAEIQNLRKWKNQYIMGGTHSDAARYDQIFHRRLRRAQAGGHGLVGTRTASTSLGSRVWLVDIFPSRGVKVPRGGPWGYESNVGGSEILRNKKHQNSDEKLCALYVEGKFTNQSTRVVVPVPGSTTAVGREVDRGEPI